jgi:ubiquinone/menaquinone biosynthesis C-methylase UbiE
MKQLVRDICPPVVWNTLRNLRPQPKRGSHQASSTEQDLEVYWDPEMAAMLETWGEDNVWQEIQLLMANCQGKVLDIACGTGRTMDFLKGFSQIELHGCDISDFLIKKAVERGIPESNLHVTDATKMKYADNEFNYSYSIGSLEHFTEDGIIKFLSESRRVSSIASFHNIPVSRNNTNHGWIKRDQSYFNNSVEWWLEKYHAVYENVRVVGSSWNDDISVGKWFLCFES